jgi:hypothetical protein
MKDNSTLKFGGVAAWFTGALLFTAALSYIFWSPEMLYVGTADFWVAILANVGLWQFTFISFTVSALFGLGVVPAVAEVVQSAQRGLVRWVSLLAILGFAVTAVNFMDQAGRGPALAENYLYQQGAYQGYGLVAFRNTEGKMLVYPYPQSPAETAGIQTGEELLAINGTNITPQTFVYEVYNSFYEKDQVTVTLRSIRDEIHDVLLQKGEVRYWDTQVQQTLSVVRIPNMDPYYFFSFGLVGIWLLVVNGIGLRRKALPKLLAILGLIAGLAYWAFILGFLVNASWLNAIGKYSGFTLGPVWYIWMGILLWKRAKEA